MSTFDRGSDAKEGMYPDDYWADMARIGIIHPYIQDVIDNLKKQQKSIEKFKARCKARFCQYSYNKKARLYTDIKCAYCFKTVNKNSYQKKFCCTTCKDKYHNSMNSERARRTCDFLRKKGIV